VQTSILTNLFSGVPAAGLHRAIKSGRGLPTAFLITSVMKDESIMLGKSVGIRGKRDTTYAIKNPRMVTWNLCTLALDAARHIISVANGIPPA